MSISRFRNSGVPSSLFAALLLALYPVAGHALSLCVCTDGDVSIDTECVPQQCCESHEVLEPEEVLTESRSDSECTELPLLPDSEKLDRIATVGARTHVPPINLVDTIAVLLTAPRWSASEPPPAPLPHPCHWESIRSTVLVV